jgi:hypothetical protein
MITDLAYTGLDLGNTNAINAHFELLEPVS